MAQFRRMMSEMSWTYPRTTTTFAVAGTAVVTAVLARAMLGRRLRPPGLVWLAPASAGAYAVIRMGSHSGWSKRFKHRVLDWFGGDVDDAQTWMLGILASGAVLVLGRTVRRAWGAPGREVTFPDAGRRRSLDRKPFSR